jgi:hypothetical protein
MFETMDLVVSGQSRLSIHILVVAIGELRILATRFSLNVLTFLIFMISLA